MKVKLEDLERAVKKMRADFDARRNAMSDRVSISYYGGSVVLSQHCEYPECYPNRYTIKTIE